MQVAAEEEKQDPLGEEEIEYDDEEESGEDEWEAHDDGNTPIIDKTEAE